MSEDGFWVVVRGREDWAQQVRDAIEAIKVKNGGQDAPTLRECHRIDPGAFSLMIEGLVALGVAVDDEMISLAGLRDIGDIL